MKAWYKDNLWKVTWNFINIRKREKTDNRENTFKKEKKNPAKMDKRIIC